MIHTAFGHSISFISQNWDRYPDINPNDQTIKNLTRNTWESWNLIPESRPTLSQPKQKTKVVSGIQNINGDIDLTLKDIPYPVFGNREGNFNFKYNPIYCFDKDNYKDWTVLYSEIFNYIHGRQLRMILEDDPGYYYDGRFSVEGWTSNTDGSGSIVSIGYSVYPYKKSINTSIQAWYWNPFNFYNGVIPTNVFDSEEGNGITISSSWHDIDLFNEEQMIGYAGTDPVIPIIWWCPSLPNDSARKKLHVKYVNKTYGIDYTTKPDGYKVYDPSQTLNSTINAVTLIEKVTIDNNGINETWYKFKDNDLIFCDAYCGEEQYISLKCSGSNSSGKFKIEFRRGSL